MKQADFVSELVHILKEKDIKLNKDELNTVITEFVHLVHNVVLYKEEDIKFNKFAVFYLGETAPRKLPNGDIVETRDIMRVRLSEKFKNKQS